MVFPRKFAICLASSSRSSGVVFFGDGLYGFLPSPNLDFSKSLIFIPLILNPVSTSSASFEKEPSADYFIGVKSILINNQRVPLNTSLLKINKEGNGGTTISTVHPYTVMETSIYKAVTKTFTNQMPKVPRVAAVPPFGTCYNSASFGSTRTGLAVPQIDLVMQNKGVFWRIFGANSMVSVSSGVVCLAIVDGGSSPRTSIVIGAHQIEDNLLQFDLARSRLGFSSSLLFRGTTCSNFNFTSKF
ncbi:basic 7S globulin-like [Carica papaya]|uniref:basic 7S globulin-like n=1 Tax=Carica papaya TaxID=3649 RepID=UPI000B8CE593|nr:basic 7S globulin-like [Carica papaya]